MKKRYREKSENGDVQVQNAKKRNGKRKDEKGKERAKSVSSRISDLRLRTKFLCFRKQKTGDLKGCVEINVHSKYNLKLQLISN